MKEISHCETHQSFNPICCACSQAAGHCFGQAAQYVPSASFNGSIANLKAPLPELEGAYPIILYFETAGDRDEFMALMAEAKPGMVMKNL